MIFLCYIFFHHITSLQNDIYIYISATPSNNTHKGLIMVILCYILSYPNISKIQVVQKGRFLRENLGSGRIRNLHKFTSRTLPQLRGGLLKTRVVLPEKT